MTAQPPPPPHAPQPNHAAKSKASEAEFDAVVAKIDRLLPKLHARATKVNGNGRAPTPANGNCPRALRRTQAILQSMAEESLLTKCGQDIRLDANHKASMRSKSILKGFNGTTA